MKCAIQPNVWKTDWLLIGVENGENVTLWEGTLADCEAKKKEAEEL